METVYKIELYWNQNLNHSNWFFSPLNTVL